MNIKKFWVVKNKDLNSYVKKYFGSKWNDNYAIVDAERFKSKKDALNFIYCETSEEYNAITGKIYTRIKDGDGKGKNTITNYTEDEYNAAYYNSEIGCRPSSIHDVEEMYEMILSASELRQMKIKSVINSDTNEVPS